MDDTKTLIEEISSKFKTESLKKALLSLTQELKESEMTHKTRIEATEDSINQVRRKNKQIESEIERLQLIQTKNTNTFNKLNSERIKMSRRIIELEQENEETECRINELTNEIDKLEREIKTLNQPSVEEFYYEIVKGFGLDFVEENGKIKARIMNKSKNDIFFVDCSKGVQEVCENIWNNIDF